MTDFKLRVVFQFEMADHGDYCSDGECKYKIRCETDVCTIHVPDDEIYNKFNIKDSGLRSGLRTPYSVDKQDFKLFEQYIPIWNPCCWF